MKDGIFEQMLKRIKDLEERNNKLEWHLEKINYVIMNSLFPMEAEDQNKFLKMNEFIEENQDIEVRLDLKDVS